MITDLKNPSVYSFRLTPEQSGKRSTKTKWTLTICKGGEPIEDNQTPMPYDEAFALGKARLSALNANI